MEYRVYLADACDRFRAAEYFDAPDDLEAEEIAAVLYARCSTKFHALNSGEGEIGSCVTPGPRRGRRSIFAISSTNGRLARLRPSSETSCRAAWI